MSNEGFYVTNPKNNNADIEIRFVNSLGVDVRFKLLKPGQNTLVDKRGVSVKEIPHPPRFELRGDGTLARDTRTKPPKLTSPRATAT